MKGQERDGSKGRSDASSAPYTADAHDSIPAKKLLFRLALTHPEISIV